MRKYIYYEIKNGGRNLIGVRRKVKGELKWGFMDCNGNCDVEFVLRPPEAEMFPGPKSH